MLFAWLAARPVADRRSSSSAALFIVAGVTLVRIDELRTPEPDSSGLPGAQPDVVEVGN